MELKTSAVAKRLGVSTKTVQRWVKKYNIPCKKNETGHYVFTNEAVEQLEKYKFLGIEEEEKEHVDWEEVEQRLNELERKIDQKADDVVSFQLLQHRREIEDMLQYIQRLEQRIVDLEHQQQTKLVHEQPKQTRRGIISLFL
ncbi:MULTISPECIES: MerR family transcriptional regulator [Anoxybacillus]|nr:MerR family transcriptional regulator [Anoxybacillus flavithermus]ASA97958.1 MerR family transcriptional regulator [Anoxybacillus flavithermus]MBE2905511.1 MerR family transcriptional regulator [Anoxybacillus flavithermus]MBE2907977.1 MerR family transcriptional regulator [Anoxybacillus flavithermus]MBE2910609.1 MerR family transcriptional regulator [Anoxybacillus flavithermus]MBE2912631.1 MerR family transcriptional regulator [Anoxybacillus flavithermus]